MSDAGSQRGDVLARILDITIDEVRRLSSAGVLIKAGPDKYNLFGSVRGYIQYLREQDKKPPTQIEIAEHLDMSERNARDVLSILKIDWRSSSKTFIRVAYIRHLREQAAGRGGDDQGKLTTARTREAEASAQLKELQIMEKAGMLIPANMVKPGIEAMITAARTELLTLPDKVAAAIKALDGHDIDPSVIQELVYESLNHLSTTMPDIGDQDVAGSDTDLGAAA